MAPVSDTSKSRRAHVILGLVATMMALVYAAAELAPVGWDPAGVIAVGEEDSVRVTYAEATFGREIPLSETVGHDGRFFFIQSMDPLLLNPAEHAANLDRPTYRAQRMLYPLLAGLAVPAGPDAVAWAMIIVNVIAFTAGTVATGRFAQSYGLSPWWGLAFAANPGVRFELDIAGGGVVAFAAVMWALVFIRQRRFTWAAIAFALAVLSREVMILAVVGAALTSESGDRRSRVTMLAVPATAVLAWWAYVQVRLAGFPSGPRIEELGIPFDGFIGALRLWVREPGVDLMIGVTYLAISLLMVSRAVRKRSLLELPAAGFGLLSILLTRQVWFRHFDISRALTPVLTLFLLSLAVPLFGDRAKSPVQRLNTVEMGSE
jgi:hypothetical protein